MLGNAEQCWAMLMLILSNADVDIIKLLHNAPRGGQKSKFENLVFGLKLFLLILTTMFEPKILNISTFRAQKLSMSKSTFLLVVWNTAILLGKMMILHVLKCQFHTISHTCHPLWNGLYYYIFHSKQVGWSGKVRNPPFWASETAHFSSNLVLS